MLIRGHLRAADIYFTEFNPIFDHYYFRSPWSEQNDETGARRHRRVYF